jgi:ATP-binding cassette, subfamily B, bacterial
MNDIRMDNIKGSDNQKKNRLRQFAQSGWLDVGRKEDTSASETLASANPPQMGQWSGQAQGGMGMAGSPAVTTRPPQMEQWPGQAQGGAAIAGGSPVTTRPPQMEQWLGQAQGGAVMIGSSPPPVRSVSPEPARPTRSEWKEEEEEEEENDDDELLNDVYSSSNNILLSALGWPFRVLATLFKPRRHIPSFVSLSMTECGAASLAMILTYYGYQTTTGEISEECGVGRDGLSAQSIVKAARRYGMQVQAISIQDTDTFEEIDLPVIIHWKFNHFLIVERWSSKRVYVVDPAAGRRTLTREEFDESFTGVTILLQPGPTFRVRHNSSRNTLLLSYLQRTLGLSPSSLIQVLLTSFILLLFGLATPTTTALVVNQIVPESLTDILLIFGAGMTVLMISQTILTYIRSAMLIRLQSKIDTNLMVTFFDHLLSLPLRYFQLRSSGDILSRLASNSVIRDTVNSQFISSILDSTSVIVYLFILVKLSPIFAVLALAFGMAQVVLMISTNHHILTLLKRSLEAQAKSQGYLTEAMVEVTTLKAAGAEKHVRSRWLRLFFAEMSTVVRRNYFFAIVSALQSIIQRLGPIVFLLVGAEQVIHGSLQLGTMLALLSLVSSFLTPLTSLVSTGQSIQQAYANMERITDVMKAESEQSSTQNLMRPPHLTGHIQLMNVSFQYDINAKPVLHNINLILQPGQKVAIVGRSGSGKSTLGKLLLGLYLPSEGEILYDNIPLRKMNFQQVRAQFGVVMQDIGLFNGSVRENIAFNAPNISIENIVKAAQAAAIHDDILKMPMDYETIVSEGGNAISGGQRQRLALARALVRNPSILLLDEATSSLDVATERVVEHNLRNLNCTQIIIAHRLSTIRNADIILVVDGGTIVEWGSHNELLQRQGFYSHLIQSQIESGDISQR